MSQIKDNRRIVVYGAECSGKTTLSESLAKYFDCHLCVEFSREYAEARNGMLSYEDVMPIANGQALNENKAFLQPKSSIFDTNLIQTAVYSDIYYDKVPIELQNMIDEGLYDHYLFCHPVKPWKQDGIRGKKMSPEDMHNRFQTELVKRNIAHYSIYGTETERFEMAVKTVSAWLKSI